MKNGGWYDKAGAAFTLLTAVMVLGGIWAGAREGWFLFGARRAQGKVVSVRTSFQNTKSGGYYKYRPTISFMDATGREWTFDSGRFGLEGRRVGAVLPVVYSPANPNDAQIASFWGEWDPTFTFGFVAVVAFVLRWIFHQGSPVKKAPPRDPAILSES